MVSLERCVGSCKSLDDLSNETENVLLKVFNIITIHVSKSLAKHISYDCECRFNVKKYNLNQKRNKDNCQCECKKHWIDMYAE